MQILVWKDSDAEMYYLADTDEQLEAAALRILDQRMRYQYIYDDGTEEGHYARAQRYLEEWNGAEAWKLLKERDDYEYEWVELNEARDCTLSEKT